MVELSVLVVVENDEHTLFGGDSNDNRFGNGVNHRFSHNDRLMVDSDGWQDNEGYCHETHNGSNVLTNDSHVDIDDDWGDTTWCVDSTYTLRHRHGGYAYNDLGHGCNASHRDSYVDS